MTNSAERIREFLTARVTAGETSPVVAVVTPGLAAVQLMEADLEAVLQLLDVLAHMAANSDPNLMSDPGYAVYVAERSVRP
jgi:hypothetical protein